MSVMVEPMPGHLSIARQMRASARRGWYLGTEATLERYGVRRTARGVTESELLISLLLSRDKMHHSVGWWRNAEYEFCWHLSIAAKEYTAAMGSHSQEEWDQVAYEDVPRAEARFWSAVIFEGVDHLLWFEPGGTDPRRREEARERAGMWHMRMFLDPESIDDRVMPWSGRPFIPTGEVYDLTRWIPGLTPRKGGPVTAYYRALSAPERRKLRIEVRRCREGGRPCRFCDRRCDLREARLRGWA